MKKARENLLRNRNHNLKHEFPVPCLYRTLAVIFFYRLLNILRQVTFWSLWISALFLEMPWTMRLKPVRSSLRVCGLLRQRRPEFTICWWWGSVFGFQGIADISRQINTPKAGKYGRPADRIYDGHLLRHKIDNGCDRSELSHGGYRVKAVF